MDSPVNLRHLHGIAAIARTGSFSAAAAAIHLTQSALTQGVATLERRLGCDLFARSVRGATPTPAGAPLADAIERLLGALDDAGSQYLPASRRGPLTHRVTYTQLLALIAVERAGSIRGGARSAGLAEASIHRAVRDLETAAGTALLIRGKAGVSATPAGQALAKGARLAMAELEQAFQAARSGHARPIVIGAMPLIRAGLLPSAIAQLCMRVPDARIQVVEGGYSELLERLLGGEVDLLLGALRETAPEGTQQRHLFDDDLVVVAQADHPLAKSGDWGFEALAGFPWAASLPGTPRRARWEEMLRTHGITPPAPQVECSSASAVRGLLLQGNWLAMLSPDQFRIERQLGLLLPLGGPLSASTRPVGITTRAGWQPNDPQALMLDIIVQCADEQHPAAFSPISSLAQSR